MRTLIEQSDWDKSYEGGSFVYDEGNVAFRDLLLRYVPANGSCLEVGCYPGNFLLYIALNRGCIVSGIDATRHLPEMVARFQRYPIRTGRFVNRPFEQVEGDRDFDCVASFGFVEHFPDFAAVISHHIDFLKPGGTLIIGLPHFRRLQYLVRRSLDPKTMDGHHLPSMDFESLGAAVRQQGLEIVGCHYWGTCAYWFDGRPYGPLRRFANRCFSGLFNFIDKRVHFPNRWSSPFMLLVARKPAGSVN